MNYNAQPDYVEFSFEDPYNDWSYLEENRFTPDVDKEELPD